MAKNGNRVLQRPSKHCTANATACLSIQGPGCHAGEVQSTEATLIVPLLVSLLVSILVSPPQLAQALDPPTYPRTYPTTRVRPCTSVRQREQQLLQASALSTQTWALLVAARDTWIWLQWVQRSPMLGRYRSEAPCWGGTERMRTVLVPYIDITGNICCSH